MIAAFCSLRSTRLAHCLQAITASGEMYCPVCSFCCFLFASGLIRPFIVAVSWARTSTLEIFSALRSWLFETRFCVNWLLRLRSIFVFFSRSADLNSPPSVSMPSRSVMYCCEWTSSTRCKTLIKSGRSDYCILTSDIRLFLGFVLFWLAKFIIYFPLSWFTFTRNWKKRVSSRDALEMRTRPLVGSQTWIEIFRLEK